ncbi:MAG: voltage-gated chloride channel protein [Verrucomicrobia bacterium]|nr:voltage-gated chloride channel protein [Verrucomicrobiota bacterium]
MSKKRILKFSFNRREALSFLQPTVYSLRPVFKKFIFWTCLLIPMAAAIGSACAFFLWSLNVVTQCRFDHPWLLYFLPLAGLAMGLIYHHIGKSAEGGNNLILEKIHQMGGGVPRRMAPLILLATLVTHLFGGSVGREGTAVQMGGSIASTWGSLFRVKPEEMRILLLSGVAAGFGAVFGTPLAAAVFSLEVLMVGHLYYEALLPALAAAALGNFFCRAWGVKHMIYQLHEGIYQIAEGGIHFDFLLLLKVAFIGIAAGLVGRLFVKTEHALRFCFKKITPYAPAWPLLGGTMIVALVLLLGTRSYIGLGEWSPNPHDITIATLFHGVNPEHAWFWKLLFTVITLAAGFKGGEVTPLFFIGAALGNLLATLLGGPSDLFTALGFVALFAGASNTPLACTIMGAELFGAGHLLEMAIVCFAAYFSSSRQGIYRAQRVSNSKKYRSVLRKKTF